MIRKIVAMSAALAFAPLLAAQADEVGGEEIVVPTIIEQEEIVIIQEAPVSLPPPGMTRENAQASEDEASSR